MQSLTVISNTSLAIFSCTNRGHLLKRTIASFKENCLYEFSQNILGIDGYIAPQYIQTINPNKIAQNYNRLGYIHNIINVLSLVETEFFFWLEDDWEFNQSINLKYLLELLQENPNWVQIRLSKIAPLAQEEKKNRLSQEIYESLYGFSANPCICRTELIKLGFRALQKSPKDKYTGFETFLSQWFTSQNLVCTVLDPKDNAFIVHSGYLESTSRQWHMTASLEGEVEDYLSGMAHASPPSPIQKVFMFYRLIKSSIILSLRQFWSRASYDLAFRIVNIIRNMD